MKKKFLILITITSICLALMTACGISPSASQSPLPVQSSPFPSYTPTPIGYWKLDIFQGGYDVPFGPVISGTINGNNYLFVGVNTVVQTDVGIVVLDLRNPKNPTQTAFLKVPQTEMAIKGMALSGATLYVAANNSLWIVDVSEPSSPKGIGELDSIRASNVVVSGNFAYVNDADKNIVALDISNPLSPLIIGNLDLITNEQFDLKVSGHMLFAFSKVVIYGPSIPVESNGLYIIDISTPASLKVISYSPNTCRAGVLMPPAARGATSSPIPVPSVYSDIAVSGNYAFVTATGPDGLQVLDLSNPNVPYKVTYLPQGQGKQIDIVDNIIYLTNDVEIRIIDVANPQSPRILEKWRSDPNYNFSDFVVTREYLYMLMGVGGAAAPFMELFKAVPFSK